jgi:hypothetical protein
MTISFAVISGMFDISTGDREEGSAATADTITGWPDGGGGGEDVGTAGALPYDSYASSPDAFAAYFLLIASSLALMVDLVVSSFQMLNLQQLEGLTALKRLGGERSRLSPFPIFSTQELYRMRLFLSTEYLVLSQTTSELSF